MGNRVTKKIGNVSVSGGVKAMSVLQEVLSGNYKQLPERIEVHGRRWFQKTYGNTYYSCAIEVDDVVVHRIDFAYGYGEQYLHDAANWLDKNGYLPDIKHYDYGGTESLWSYCRDRGIIFKTSVSDVHRKKDL